MKHKLHNNKERGVSKIARTLLPKEWIPIAILFFTICLTANAQTVNIADGDVPGLITAINAANTNPGADVINLVTSKE